MDIAKKLTETARASGKIKEGNSFFTVTDKKQIDAGGGEIVTVEVPNGIHHVKILSEKIGKGKDFEGKEAEQLQLIIMDNGQQKEWNMPIKNKDGTLYYIVAELETIEIGEEFIVQAAKMKTGKYAKRISRIGKGEQIPTIQLNDENNEGAEGELPPLTEATDENIDPSSIPF
jgi:hypothetical protein